MTRLRERGRVCTQRGPNARAGIDDHAIASPFLLRANLSPWRGDPQTRQWTETESLDLSFHFPGWSPRLECRSLLMQLRISTDRGDDQLRLLGVLMRGMTYDGERWRLAWLVNGAGRPPPASAAAGEAASADLSRTV